MMKKLRTLSALMLALLLAVSMTAPAFAASGESAVIYTGRQYGFEFEPGSYYTETDLFENFKGVVPGDVLYEEVTVINDSNKAVRIWMGGLLHDEEGNPISPRVLEELQADDRKGELSELEFMHEFLAQLTLTVWFGDMIDENIIYQGHPNSLEEGFEDGFVPLGLFVRGQEKTLNVRLEVPIELGNEYAHRIGEVDWIFVIEETTGPGPDPTPEPTPEPTPGPTHPVEPTDPPVDPTPGPTPTPTEKPDDDTPQTGDNTVIWPFIGLFAVGLIGMIITLFAKRRKDEEEE